VKDRNVANEFSQQIEYCICLFCTLKHIPKQLHILQDVFIWYSSHSIHLFQVVDVILCQNKNVNRIMVNPLSWYINKFLFPRYPESDLLNVLDALQASYQILLECHLHLWNRLEKLIPICAFTLLHRFLIIMVIWIPMFHKSNAVELIQSCSRVDIYKSIRGTVKSPDPSAFSSWTIQTLLSLTFKTWTRAMNDFFPAGLDGNAFSRIIMFGFSFFGKKDQCCYW